MTRHIKPTYVRRPIQDLQVNRRESVLVWVVIGVVVALALWFGLFRLEGNLPGEL